MKKSIPIAFAIIFSFCLAGCEKDSKKSVTDIDGNVYKTVTIGSQVWMAENLKVTRFNDGTPIETVYDSTQLTQHYDYNWYDGDASNKDKYGGLYSWDAVNTGKLAPEGWHVPTDAEWATLIDYLGGSDAAGGKLKEKGTDHWVSPNTGATNKAKFNARAGGFRDLFGYYSELGKTGFWLSAIETYPNSEYAFGYMLKFDSEKSFREDYFEKNTLYSVRCIKD